MKYSFILMRVSNYYLEPGGTLPNGTLTATPIAHAGCEADEDGLEQLIVSDLIMNFGTCVAAFELQNKTPALVNMCFRYDFAQNSSTLKRFIDCSCD